MLVLTLCKKKWMHNNYQDVVLDQATLNFFDMSLKVLEEETEKGNTCSTKSLSEKEIVIFMFASMSRKLFRIIHGHNVALLASHARTT